MPVTASVTEKQLNGKRSIAQGVPQGELKLGNSVRWLSSANGGRGTTQSDERADHAIFTIVSTPTTSRGDNRRIAKPSVSSGKNTKPFSDLSREQGT